MSQLCYENTFLTVKDRIRAGPRSKSMDLPRASALQDCPEVLYVATLEQKAWQTPVEGVHIPAEAVAVAGAAEATHMDEAAAPAEAVAVPPAEAEATHPGKAAVAAEAVAVPAAAATHTDDAAAAAVLVLDETKSFGSAGHPQLCNKPCLFLRLGECPHGAECRFCHLPHPNPAKLDKRMRETMRGLPPAEVLALLLPHLRVKNVTGAGRLLAEMEARLAALPHVSCSMLPPRIVQLKRALGRLSFRQLMLLSPEGTHAQAELEHLRRPVA
ncbi:unnamed protein product [Effrenium voratum]|uniref:C3H1-type domain-containing protein n=1 Tax=Effrenium voratum TaxID=2562239 RepID=A0AA36NBJ0_9DINO|nr:unnamed protein product [Effrenium voratum]CAJ1442471.1 unnamed protein product [Effrenium voratum]